MAESEDVLDISEFLSTGGAASEAAPAEGGATFTSDMNAWADRVITNQRGDDKNPLLGPTDGDLPEGFETGAVTVPGIRGNEIPEFRQDTVAPGTAATFRKSSLDDIAAWPEQKRARLVLQMQRAGLISPQTNTRFWNKDISDALKDALTFANVNGITDPFEAVGVYGSEKVAADQQARPKFNFVSRDMELPDPEGMREEIRGLAKKMFAGTDIELSDEEVEQLRGQFEGLLKEQHFNAEQQRLGEEKTSFDAQVASAQGETFTGSVPAVPQIDAAARFRNVFEERYQPELNAIDKMAEDNVQREAATSTLSRVMQFATGRQ